MNTYNKAVVDQFCYECRYTPVQKEKLITRLERAYGHRLDLEDILWIKTRFHEVVGTLEALPLEESELLR